MADQILNYVKEVIPLRFVDRLNILFSILAGLTLIFGIFVFLMNVNLMHPLIQFTSCSNYPILEPGNIVLVEDTDFENIEEGDTVIYEVPSTNMVVAHQVVNKSESSLQTRGENNPRQLEFEKDVEKSQVWGTKGFVIPITKGSKCSAT